MMKTYAKISTVGTSHIHFLNNILCHVSLQLSNNTGLIHEQAIDALENLVLRDRSKEVKFTSTHSLNNRVH